MDTRQKKPSKFVSEKFDVRYSQWKLETEEKSKKLSWI